MNKFATGMIAGGLVGILGLSWAMSDRRMRKRMVRDTKKVMRKANDLMENVPNIF